MNREKYEELKQLHAELTNALSDVNLSDQQRYELELNLAAIAGQLCSIWLPVSIPRKIIMLSLITVGLIGIIEANYIYILFIFAAAFFSPRIVATTAFYIGKFSSAFK